MSRHLCLVAIIYACTAIVGAQQPPQAKLGVESSRRDSPEPSQVYLHLYSSHRAPKHDPDWRPVANAGSAERWTLVTTVLVRTNTEFFVRVPGNRDPYVQLAGKILARRNGKYFGTVRYELDDSNLTYSDVLKQQFKLGQVAYIDDFYWKLLLSKRRDSYEALEHATEPPEGEN